MFSGRLTILFAVLTLLVVGLTTRLVHLQLALGKQFQDLAGEYPVRVRYLSSLRGSIITQDGLVLAEDRASFDLAMDYPYLRRPLDPKWLQRHARALLPNRAARNDPVKRAEAKRRIEARVERLWHDVAELTKAPLEEIREGAKKIQRRVERMKTHLNRIRKDKGLRPFKKIEEERTSHVLVPLDQLDALTVVAAIESNPWRYPGVHITEQARRVYPQGRLACHIVGYVGGIPRPSALAVEEATHRLNDRKGYDRNDLRRYFLTDQVGRAGVEKQYEDHLRGRRGKVQELMAAGYRVHRTLQHTDPVRGTDVPLTIHAELQAHLENLLVEPGHIPGPLRGAIVVMDVHSGALLSLASNPGFDPNWMVQRDPRMRQKMNPIAFVDTVPRYKAAVADLRARFGASGARAWSHTKLLAAARGVKRPSATLRRHIAAMDEIVAQRRQMATDARMLNRATRMRIAVGSIFKPITAVAALHSPGGIDAHSQIRCNGYMTSPTAPFKCWIYSMNNWRLHHGPLDVVEALQKSCNIFFYTCAERIGLQHLSDWAWRMGLGRKTGVDLPGEDAGFLPTPDRIRARFGRSAYRGEAKNLAIGQGCLQITPLQVTRAIAAIANGGWLVTPHVVVGQPAHRQRVRGIDSRKLQLVRRGMGLVVSSQDGTAHRYVYLKDLPIAGKTGTAQAGKARKDHAWFACYVPADRPKYAMVIGLQHVGSGGFCAGQLAKKAIEFMRQKGFFAPAYPPKPEPQRLADRGAASRL